MAPETLTHRHAVAVDLAALLAEAAERFRSLAAPERDELQRVLWADVTSEYDARFLSRHLRERFPTPSPAFAAAEAAWERDEADHHHVFLELYERLYPEHDARADLAARRPDFAALEPLLRSEFTTACLGAYDEFTTVRAYTACLPLYARLGPRLTRYVRTVIADEACHYHRFLLVARATLPSPAALPAFLTDLRRIEGTPYAATFFLDHDDAVFTTEVCHAAERALMRHLP